MISLFRPITLLLMIAGCLTPLGAAEHAPGPQSLDVTLQRQDHLGQLHTVAPHSRKAARVLVFLTGECPIARSYFPQLNRLYEAWGKNEGEIELLGVWADVTQSPRQVAEFVHDLDIQFPVLLDRDAELGAALTPTNIPEAFVLNAEGAVLYRGRIDDRYLELGKRRPQATEETLRDAAEAVANDKPVAMARTEPVGCYYELPPQAEAGSAELTYNRDIAPILYANCVVCHREGEVGPFPLTSYLDAAKRARQIAKVVELKLMPPWKAAQTHGEFEGQRTLTKREIATLTAWAKTERAEGDAADRPPLPTFADQWHLGPPDLVLEMDEDFIVPADGPDIFQNFPIPYDIPEDKLVAAVDFKPGDSSVVHHSLLFLDNSGRARKRDAKTPEPGYSTFGGPGFAPSGSIGGWSPGKTPRPLPNGLGRKMDKGSDLVMQIHYHPTGKETRDRSKVGIYFVDKPKDEAFAIWTSSFDLDIPPGEANYKAEASYTLPADLTMLSCIPHMHLLGQEMTVTARLPDGTTRQLIHVPQWDFNWQDEYMYAQPFKLPKGTRLEVVARYDNSEGNPSNPSSPPKRVTFGEETTDEMLYCFFLVVADDPRHVPAIVADTFTQEALRQTTYRLKRNRDK